ncbi:MAG: hypothetical protein ABIP17_01315 [Ilumatobacteraceae bacterium]
MRLPLGRHEQRLIVEEVDAAQTTTRVGDVAAHAELEADPL